jgi:uncharacterized protein with HEPN domain
MIFVDGETFWDFVWGIVEKYLPPLRQQVKGMLDELPPEIL